MASKLMKLLQESPQFVDTKEALYRSQRIFRIFGVCWRHFTAKLIWCDRRIGLVRILRLRFSFVRYASNGRVRQLYNVNQLVLCWRWIHFTSLCQEYGHSSEISSELRKSARRSSTTSRKTFLLHNECSSLVFFTTHHCRRLACSYCALDSFSSFVLGGSLLLNFDLTLERFLLKRAMAAISHQLFLIKNRSLWWSDESGDLEPQAKFRGPEATK